MAFGTLYLPRVPTTLSAEIDQPRTIPAIASVHLKLAADRANLDGAERHLRENFKGPRWFVYRGGSHVALHRARDGVAFGPRLGIVAEREVQS